MCVNRHSPPGGESGSSVDILSARALLKCGEGGNAWLKFSSCNLTQSKEKQKTQKANTYALLQTKYWEKRQRRGRRAAKVSKSRGIYLLALPAPTCARTKARDTTRECHYVDGNNSDTILSSVGIPFEGGGIYTLESGVFRTWHS